MRAAADILDDQAEGLGELITVEMGKPIAQSVAEVHKSVKAMRYYAEHSEDFLADVELDDPSRDNASQAWTRYEPLGVVLALMVGKAIDYPAFTVPWGTLVTFVIAAIVVGLIAAIFPARRAGKLNVLEALQYE